jgi:hypothetical protein
VAAPPPPTCEPWTTPEEVRQCCAGLDPAYDLTDAIQFASEVLYRLSGHRFPGECERVVWPCRGDNCGCRQDPAWGALAASGWHWAMWPHSAATSRAGGWVNCWDCGIEFQAGDGCGCGGNCKLPCLNLPASVNEVVEIVIGGEVLDPSAYRIKAHRQICRVDGGTWPCWNRMSGVECVNTDEIVEFAVDATGGVWDLVLDWPDGTQTIVALNATDTGAQVQAAIEAVLGVGTVVVAGGPGDAGATSPYVVTFSVTALGRVPVATGVGVSLVGGASVVTTTVTQEGCLAAPGDWWVRYRFGTPPTPGGRIAASILACQIALNRCGGDGCILPQRLREITREGVQMAFADPLEFLDKGQVGIYEVDLWLASVNPNKIMRRASVYRADDGPAPTTFTG